MNPPTMNTKPIALMVFAMSVFQISPSGAASPIVSIPQAAWDYYGAGLGSEAHGNGMAGWTFYVNSPVTVTQIGWHDRGSDGLSRAFQVGLWRDTSGGAFSAGNSVEELLGTAGSGLVIPSGTAAMLNGYFRVVDLDVPIVLQPGSYQIAGLDTASTTDPITYMWDGGIGIYNTPGVSVGAFFYGDMTGSGYPPMPSGFTWVDNSHFYLASGLEMGPMLFVVPETSTPTLVMLGMFLRLSRRRVKRHSDER